MADPVCDVCGGIPAARRTVASARRARATKWFQEPFPVEWGALLNTMEKSGSLTGLLNCLEWTITPRAVTECGGNKSRAEKVLGRTYRWLSKLESEMMESKPSLGTSSKRQ